MVDDKRLEELAEYYGDRDLSEEIGSADLQRSPGDQVMVVTSLRVPKPLMDRVRDAATDEGLKPSALMRYWIESGLTQYENPPGQGSASLDQWSELMHRVVREELEKAGLR